MTEIQNAIFNCDLKKLKICLQDRRKVHNEIPGTEGCTPLHLIVGIENVSGRDRDEVLSYLLEIGADPNARSYEDLTPVHIAAMRNNCSELEKLLQNGGNPWLTDNENKNAFDISIDNHAYESYQLLNKYLSEEKLNFRVGLTKNNTELNYYKQNSMHNNVIIDDNMNSRYVSAREDFPLYFSSTDEESGDFFINDSKILKKSLAIEKQEIEQKNSSSDFPEKITSNNELESSFGTCTNNYFTDYSEPVEEKVCTTETQFSTDGTEIYSTSEEAFIVPTTESFEKIVDSDDKSGIVLVEKKISAIDFSSVKNCDMSYCSNHTINDWKRCHSQSMTSLSEISCSSHRTTLLIPPDYMKLSNTTIYLQLKNMGDNPGPVSNSTREIYLRRLTRLKAGCNTTCILPTPKYCSEMYTFLEGKLNTDRVQVMMNIMSEEFDSLDPNKKWREGNQRCCFNYFLLDPRVTQNLPLRLKELPFEKAFLTFVDALFYVGKGMRGRPYHHLLEAAKAANDVQWKNDKVSHILDIWESGLGVISLHCFNNCIPVEAYTQEACIIDAIGLENLTNIKNGNYYGVAAKWKWSWKRQVGVALLHRALQIFILEGEKQIMPKDIKTK